MGGQNKQAELDAHGGARDEDYGMYSSSFYGRIRDALPLAGANSSKVLEVGCGTASVGKRIVEWYPKAEVTGIDIAPGMISYLRGQDIPRYTGIVGDAEDVELFQKDTFDLVLCPMILHHFPDPTRVLQNAFAWCKQGGSILLVEPNGSSPVNRFFKFGRRFLERTCGTEYTKRFATCNETDHSMPRYLKILSEAGFDVWHRTTFINPPMPSPEGVLGWTRTCLNMLFRCLPRPYCGDALIIIADKKAEELTGSNN